MNPIPYLDRACGIAFSIDIPTQRYSIAALGLRADGRLVHASNKATRPRTSVVRIKESHAEHRLAIKLDQGAVVFVARSSAEGHWTMAKPCANCEKCLRRAKVRKVYYTIARGEYGVLHLR